MNLNTNRKIDFSQLKETFLWAFYAFAIICFCAIISCKSSNDTKKSESRPGLERAEKFSEKPNKQNFENSNNNFEIPKKALEIRNYVRKNRYPKSGYIGGRQFKNLEKKLPIFDEYNQRIKYQEWDINLKIRGKNRGPERLVTGSNGSDYYTNDHYKSFKKLNDYNQN